MKIAARRIISCGFRVLEHEIVDTPVVWLLYMDPVTEVRSACWQFSRN